ncbi:MAG: class I SAM-dependent methyltransferase [Thiohalocapsa sp.]
MAELDKLDLAGSPERFGYEWNAYAGLLPQYEEQFRRWTVHLAPEDWQGKSFLDVGCGMGRNSVWPMRYGAREGCAVDIDERSLAQARRNLAAFERVEVLRASAFELPFEGRFDIVFSIGVIHHLENPPLALARMVNAWRQARDARTRFGVQRRVATEAETPNGMRSRRAVFTSRRTTAARPRLIQGALSSASVRSSGSR